MSESSNVQSCGSKMKSLKPAGDWITELYAPIYDFDAIVERSKNGSGLEEPHIKRAPILDPVTVREVFERVHQRVVDAERVKAEEVKERKEEADDKRINPRSSIIWDTEELGTLRKVYKSARGEISRLEAALRDSKAHNSQLKSELVKEKEESESLREKLLEAGKSNQRLVIHRDNLQQQVAVLEVKVAALTDMWHEIDKVKLQAMEDAKQCRMQLDSERLTRQKLESDLDLERQDVARQRELVERDIQTRCEIEINDLQDVIKDLTVELAEEKQKHLASRRGLEHLRLHFSSLPLQDVLPPGVVTEDQVKAVDHIHDL